ncbi:MAG: MFS transporter [Anaerolineae bacterium]|nr:MFS transporter [Anaerolineae bacterium]
MTTVPAERPGADAAGQKAGWAVLAMLAAAQFIMVLDTTVMNVSISQVAEDLNTTVVGMQTAITMYTLVMAAFMLLGGKLGDRWGAKRAYAIGLLVYGAGSLITALAPSLGVLLAGWSFIEGFGAILVIPAIAALIAATYQGRQRAIAYGVLGGISGVSAALGPLIGGWVTANFTWRLVFAAETVTVLILMLFLRAIPAGARREGKLDLPGVVLSAAGLGLAVFGILRSSQWGWITPSPAAPVTPLGLSPVFWLIIAGAVLLGLFAQREGRVIEAGQEPLLDTRLLKLPMLRAGLTTLLSQQFIIMSIFFVLPLYLQTVLGFDSLQTGITILPLSLSLFLFALIGASLTARMSPRRIVEIGLAAMISGTVLLIAFTGPDLRNLGFALALALVGAGNGLMVSQLGNVIMSSVPPSRGSEAGGLQGTAMNLGASLGTALIGSLLLASLVLNFQKGVLANEALAGVSTQLSATAEANANFVTVEQVGAAAEAAGLSPEQAQAAVTEYAEAQIVALKAAFAGVLLAALVALWYVRHLPTIAGASAGAESAAAEASEPEAAVTSEGDRTGETAV